MSQKLHAAILAFFRRDLVEAEIFLPWSEQKLRGNIFENFEVLEERADGAGTFFRIRGEPDTVNALRSATRPGNRAIEKRRLSAQPAAGNLSRSAWVAPRKRPRSLPTATNVAPHSR